MERRTKSEFSHSLWTHVIGLRLRSSPTKGLDTLRLAREGCAAGCVIIVYAIEVAPMQTTKVGIREFRENLAEYLESETPVAITRHGATIGIYVPTKPKVSQADLEALRVAGEKMQELIAAAGTTEDAIVADFKKLRSERRVRKN